MGKIAVLAMTEFALGSPQSTQLACTSRGILECRSNVLVHAYFLFRVFLYFMKVGASSFVFGLQFRSCDVIVYADKSMTSHPASILNLLTSPVQIILVL